MEGAGRAWKGESQDKIEHDAMRTVKEVVS